jgi:tetratricopeptide (TPR) repeat protein/capsular polysaccharide biosynthesis protein
VVSIVQSVSSLQLPGVIVDSGAKLAYQRGLTYHQQGRWSDAIAAYQDAIAHWPDYGLFHFQLGLVYDQQQQLDQAIACYRQAIALLPNYFSAHSNLGCALLKQGQIEAAIHTLQVAIAHNSQQASLYNNLGRAYHVNGQIDEAIAAYQDAIRLQPDLVPAHLNLGCLWQEQKQTQAAISCFERVVQLDSKQAIAHSRWGQILWEQGHVSAALTQWQKAIALQSTWIAAYCRQVTAHPIHDELDQVKQTCAQFLQALQQDILPADTATHLAQTYHQLGDLLLNYGGIEQAEIYFRQALHVQPQSADLHLKLGDCFAHQHRFDAALMIYHLARVQQPHSPSVLHRIGHILECQQRPQQAIHYYRTALSARSQAELPPVPHFPTATHSYQLPQRLYHSTQAWAAATQLQGVHYVEVAWNIDSPNAAVTAPASHEVFNPAGHPQPEHALSQQPQGVRDRACGGVTCQPCMARLRSEFEPIQCRPGLYRCTAKTPVAVESMHTFVVTIPDGRAWIAPQQNSWMICNSIAIITPDGALLADVSRDYPWYLPGCDRHDPTQHRLFRLPKLPPLQRFEGRVAVLSGLSGHVYYHWMVDVLPRLGLLQRSKLDLTEIDQFVVNGINHPFQDETLTVLGIPKDKILVSDRHPHIQADELVVPSFPGYLDWVSADAIAFLRQTFWLPSTLQSPSPKRLYISRNRARYRHVLNEAAVIDTLRPYGFVVIELESLSVNQQVSLFAQANIIVAPHGAGLTNIIFCQPGTQIIELTSPHYVRADYWRISQQLDLIHYVIQGEVFACTPLRQVMYQNPLTEDILVPQLPLQAALEELGVRPSCIPMH